MSAIWPGLNRLITFYIARQKKGGIRFEYPFRIYPPPAGFDRGMFNQSTMDTILALWKRLHPKAQTGGRVQMDTIELRTAIFAIRTNLHFLRERWQAPQDLHPKSKNHDQIDRQSLHELKIKSQRVIRSLERHIKRANRALQKSITCEEYVTLLDTWAAHLRWMGLRLTYFKHLRPVVHGLRLQRQKDLDELMEMAKRGIRNAGFIPPEPKELRRVVRLFARSSRRWREGQNTVRYMLDHKRHLSATWYLAQFVQSRLTLEALRKS